jgi:predicted nucleic acid-binding protein
LIYIDTSALIKLVKDDEPEGPALRAYVRAATDRRFVSSALVTVEARRGVLRFDPRSLPRTDLLLSDVIKVEMSAAVLESASRLPDPMLRSLDAIHLATALSIRTDLDVVLSYDQRLLAAAASHGLPTAAPA